MSINKYRTYYNNLPVQIKASFWFMICSFLQNGIAMITTPIFTRLMNTAEYGQFSVFNSWQGIITIFVSLNLSLGVYTQGLIKFDSEQKVFSSSLQGLSTTLVLLWIIIYFLFKNFWNNLFSLTTVQMTAMFILIWTSSVFSFWSAEQRVFYKYKNLVIITIIYSILSSFAGIFAVVYSEDKVIARILSRLLVELILFSGLFFAQMKSGKVFYSKKFWLYALSFNIPLIPHYLSQIILNSADRIMINDIIGASEAGIYNLAYSISQIMTIFNSSILATLNPWIYEKIKEKKEKDVAPIAYSSLIIIAILNLLLILFAPEIIKLFAPSPYHDAIGIIPPVSMSVFFIFSYDLFAKHAFYYEKKYFIMISSILAAILNVCLNYIFIPKYGFIAAGYTTLISFIVYTSCHYLFMIKVCDQYCNNQYPYSTKILLLIAMPFLILGFVFLATYSYPFIRYTLIFIIFSIFFIRRKDIILFINKIKNLK